MVLGVQVPVYGGVPLAGDDPPPDRPPHLTGPRMWGAQSSRGQCHGAILYGGDQLLARFMITYGSLGGTTGNNIKKICILVRAVDLH